MDAQTITAVVSAFLAAASAGVSVYYSHKATRYAERSAQNQHEDQMRVWAERTVDVTAELVELLSGQDGEDEFNARSGQLFVALRCQIDKGRWFFPNIHADKKGEWKPPAFRGIRQPILNVLVDLFDATKNADWQERESALAKVEQLHREFVSEVQERLNPAQRDANYRKYMREYEDLSSQFVQESLKRPDRPHAGGQLDAGSDVASVSGRDAAES